MLIKNDLEHLKILSLRSTQVTTLSLQRLAMIKIPQLQQLDLSMTLIDPQAILHLKSFSSSLAALFLNNCDLDSSVLGLLTEISFAKLQQLHLDYNKFSGEEVLNFAADLQRNILPQLGLVSLRGVSLREDTYEKVVKVLSSKGIQFKLDHPYNMAMPNSARY